MPFNWHLPSQHGLNRPFLFLRALAAGSFSIGRDLKSVKKIYQDLQRRMAVGLVPANKL